MAEPDRPAAQPIRILGIIEEQIGAPRNDGTRGSALYEVPFRLSSTPSEQWAALFLSAWDHPPQYTSRHRPGIAMVVGDTVILTRTNMQEVEECHKDTLLLAIEVANKQFQQSEEAERRRQEAERLRIAKHEEEVRKAARGIKFD